MAKTKSMTCPHCGSAAIFTQHPVLKCFLKAGELRTYADDYGRTYGTGFRSDADECEFYAPELVCLWRCPNCKKLTLEINGKISYPIGSGIPAVDCMPQDAKEVFEEAQSIINLSPRAACAMLRICVERMVNASGAKGGNLDDKINSLGLPATMARMAHACRLVGNDAVHNAVIDFSVGSDEAQAVSGALSRFANRLAEELFGMAAEADEWTAKIEATRPKKK